MNKRVNTSSTRLYVHILTQIKSSGREIFGIYSSSLFQPPFPITVPLISTKILTSTLTVAMQFVVCIAIARESALLFAIFLSTYPHAPFLYFLLHLFPVSAACAQCLVGSKSLNSMHFWQLDYIRGFNKADGRIELMN